MSHVAVISIAGEFIVGYGEEERAAVGAAISTYYEKFGGHAVQDVRVSRCNHFGGAVIGERSVTYRYDGAGKHWSVVP